MKRLLKSRYRSLFYSNCIKCQYRFSGIVSADSSSANEQVKNGDFEDGLNNWILSNPNSSTENIGTSEPGNHYLKLIHADTAYQPVTVKPNTEYTLTFDIAGSIGSPSEVTVGNLNAHQEIVPLTKSNIQDLSRNIMR